MLQHAKREHIEMRECRKSTARDPKLTCDELEELKQETADKVRHLLCMPSALSGTVQDTLFFHCTGALQFLHCCHRNVIMPCHVADSVRSMMGANLIVQHACSLTTLSIVLRHVHEGGGP
jgi:hypothetical protein